MKIQNIPQAGRGLCVLVLAAAAVSAEAAEKTHRYFRFQQTKLRSSTANSIQVSEFEFKLADTPLSLTGVVATNPGGANPGGGNEGPEKAIDLDVNTKWLDFNKQAIVFDFGAPVTIDEYNFATANDSDGRDPVSWVFSGSDDNVNWTPLDVRTDQVITTTRLTYQAGWEIPETLAPQIDSFTTSMSVVLNGTTNVTADWTTALADTVTLTGYGTVAASGSQVLTLPDNADTALTLEATSAFGTATASRTVRTVAGGTADFQYIRFTPIKFRAASNSIQLSEFFFKNGATFVPIQIAYNDVGGNSPDAETPTNLFDDNVGTKWLDFSKGAVIFDMGGNFPFDSYGFATANDAPERDPVRWILEGSNDQENWTLLDNLTAFDVAVPVARQTYLQDVPLPGTSLIPFVSLTGETKVISGEPVTLVWESQGGATWTLNGDPVTASGSMDISPTVDTVYTFVATSAGAVEATATLSVDVIEPAITEIDYANFDAAGEEIALLGQATILNDFAQRPVPGDAKRLRITPDAGSATGAAWFRKRLDFSEGFETTFDLHFVNITGGGEGADGLAFVIHNDALRTQAFPQFTQEDGLPENALNVTFDSHQNEDDVSAAMVEIRSGANLLTAVNLADFPTLSLGGSIEAKDLSRLSGSAPVYAIRITYVPGDLDVYFDGVLVVDSLNVDLAAIGALDAGGLGYTGFTSRTGGFYEAHDVTSWKLATGVPAAPLMLTAFSITGGATPSATLDWTSSPGRTYRITTSGDLVDWSHVAESGIAADVDGVNSMTVPLPAGTKRFVRVEEE